MKKLFALMIALMLVLSAAALAEVDTSAWVELPVGESGYTILVPGDMIEEEVDPTCTSWDERNITIYNAGCQDLNVEIGKFEGVATMDEVKEIMSGLGVFEGVELLENGVLNCFGADDMVYVVCVGSEAAGFYCVSIAPLEKDPDAVEPDFTDGIEMSEIVYNSLKLA